MTRAIVWLLFFAPVAWARIAGAGEPCGGGSVDCCTLGGIAEGDISMDGYDLTNLDDIYESELTSDTAPRVRVEAGQNAWPRASTNVTGANHVEAAGVGVRVIEITNAANMAGDVVTVSVSAQGVVTAVAKTEGVASPNGWPACAALTTAQCALGLYNLLNGAGAISGAYVLCADATCSNSKVYVGCTPGSCSALSIAYTSGGSVGATVTHENSGHVTIPTGRLRIDTPAAVGTGGMLIGNASGGFTVRNYGDTAGGILSATDLYGTSSVQINTLATYGGIKPYADDGMHFVAGAGDGTGNRSIVIVDSANSAKDHDHDTLQANPTLFVHSVTDPDSDNTQWISFTHDQTNGLITSGKGAVSLGPEIRSAGVSSDGTGKALCVKADGNIGTCTDAVGAGGTCTCN